MATQSDPKSAAMVDSKYRKLYRAVIEISRNLDSIYKSSNAFSKIFQQDTITLREKLRQYCETLIFKQPLEFGRKAEEILWRQMFYEIINIVKTSKKNLKSNSEIETMYRLHLSTAFGYYNNLILRMQYEFNCNLDLDAFLDFAISNKDKTNFLFQSLSFNRQETQNIKEFAIKSIHKTLISLGDLARYQIDYDPRGCKRLAQKYYFMSMILIPENGMPLNQLGTLSSNDNYGCDAAYYYLYCLSCIQPFGGAKKNLKSLLLKNDNRYEHLRSLSRQTSTKTSNFSEAEKLEFQCKEIKKFLVTFLKLISMFLGNYLESSSTASSNTNLLQELCQTCLKDFNMCLFYRPINEFVQNMNQDYRPSYLSDDLIFKLQLIILMTIERIKRYKNNKMQNLSSQVASNNSNSTAQKNTILFTAIAFSFLFFSHIVNHSVLRFESFMLQSNKNEAAEAKKMGSDNEAEKAKEISKTEEAKSNSDNSDNDSDDSSSSENGQSRIHLLYGRRRRRRNSDSDSLNSECSNDNFYLRKKNDQKSKQVSSSEFDSKEFLSEDEINNFSSDDHNDSDNDDENSKIVNEVKDIKNISEKHENVQNNTDKYNIFGLGKDVFESNVSSEILTNLTPFDSYYKTDLQKNTYFSSTFKEFSTQLYNNYLSFENINDYIDNELYKCVLTGKKQVSVPPGFEANAKEAQEIEELGVKLATFQIDTDSEMSHFNTDAFVSSSSDTDSDDSKYTQKKKKIPFNAHLNSKEVKLTIDTLHKQGTLPTIKIFCDWLLCNKKIIQSLSQVSQTVWSKLAILLNCIPLEKEILAADVLKNDYVRKLILRSFETILWNTHPLSEDIQLCSFDALKFEHSALKYDLNNLSKLNPHEETVIRICCLRRFGYLLASLSKSQMMNFFSYDANKELFAASQQEFSQKTEEKKQTPNQTNNVATEKEKENDRKLRLMRDLAQLRLQAEISQLETSYKDDTNWSPYIVPDIDAMCQNLKIVQELSNANKFIIIIPLIVIEALDFMKKDSKVAREAIRWLENQFKLGNRFIRAQSQNETISGNQNAALKNKDIDAWRNAQLIDCCKYFKKQFEKDNLESNNFQIITLLTNFNLDRCKENSTETRVENLVKASNKEKIEIRNIKEYYEKWLSS